MAPESVSFRITRSTEDLAHTIHTLSQRVVKLEQRLAAAELLLDRRAEPDPGELTSLETVERLIDDCRQLLELSPTEAEADDLTLASAAGPAPILDEAEREGGSWEQAA
jgi:hypothetical protein